MEPSRKHFLIAALVVFAGLQPSAAIRGTVAQPSTRPQFFFPPLPCLPGFPWNLLPCYEPPPPRPLLPTECWSPLMKMVRPCAEYLTNASVSSPPDECCDHYNGLVDSAAICLCHVANGEIGKLLPAPLNMTQLFAMPHACSAYLRLKDFTHCNMKDVPPMTPPPAPGPPPPAA